MFAKNNRANPHGRPLLPEVEKLRQAIAEVEVEKKISLYKFVVERALQSDMILATILKKFIPDMTRLDVDAKVTFKNLLELLRGFQPPVEKTDETDEHLK